MRMTLFGLVLVGLWVSPASALPSIPSSAVIHAALQDDGIILVKKKWKARPYGWSQGRKVGWKKRGLPPGQAKKRLYY